MYNELNSNISIEYLGDEETDEGNYIEPIQKIVKKTEAQKKYIMDKVREMQKFKYEFKPSNGNYGILLHQLNQRFQSGHRFSQNQLRSQISKNELESVQLKIFEELKVRFPDCLIQIDPLKTYILIDWN